MAVRYLVKGEPLAALDDVDRMLDIHTSPPYAGVRSKYRLIAFDVEEEAELLRARARAARDAFLCKDDAADRATGAQEDVREVVAAFEAEWIRPLTHAVYFAIRRGHPAGDDLRDLIRYERLDADHYRGARYVAEKLVGRLRAFSDVASLRLPPDFLARGEAFVRLLPEERREANELDGVRALGTLEWHDAIDELAEGIELWIDARNFAQDVSGSELPPINMPFSRTAAGSRSSGSSDSES